MKMKSTNEELIRLIRNGDEAKKVDLLENNRGMIYKLMGEFGYLLRNEEDRDDLFQAGCLGLMKALNRYDFKYNTQFSTFAYRYIHGEIVRLADAIMHRELTYTDLLGKGDSDMVAEEIAEFVHRSVTGEIDPHCLETEVLNREVLRNVLKDITPRQRDVLLYRYTLDMTQSDIGKILGIHQVDVSREEKRAKTKLRLLFGEHHCGVY